MDETMFVTKVRTALGKQAARLLIESIRTFGGEMSRCSLWLFAVDPLRTTCQELESDQVRVIPLGVPDKLLRYDFGDKVYACACAEKQAPARVHSLVWIDLSCLVVNPPVLYDLSGPFDAAVRPVHIRNVGLRENDPLDAYWSKIFGAVGVEDITFTVESFADRQRLRAYFNTHAFAIDPAKGLLHRWLECFEKLVSDQDFQAGACKDELHQIFLHQAVLSALIASAFEMDRVRVLPPEYNYPYNLHPSLPPDRQAKALNDLVSFTYEDRSIRPSDVDDIEIHEPLSYWLTSHIEQPQANQNL